MNFAQRNLDRCIWRLDGKEVDGVIKKLEADGEPYGVPINCSTPALTALPVGSDWIEFAPTWLNPRLMRQMLLVLLEHHPRSVGLAEHFDTGDPGVFCNMHRLQDAGLINMVRANSSAVRSRQAALTDTGFTGAVELSRWFTETPQRPAEERGSGDNGWSGRNP